MWEEVLSWRLTRSRILSVTAGALVMGAFWPPRASRIISLLALFRNQFQMDFVKIVNPANTALRQSMDRSVPTCDCSGVAREPTAKTFSA
jgi:hypothetical protein